MAPSDPPLYDLVEVLLPVFSVIGLGVAARSAGFPGDGFWRPAERLTYYLLFPALLAMTLAKAELTALPVGRMAAGIAAAIGFVSLLAFAAKPFLAIEGPRFTSLYQGTIRMNTYVGLALASRLSGETGLDHAAVAIAVIVPLVNLACVVSLARFGSRQDGSALPIVRSVLTNPLILGSLIGLVLNVTNVGSPPILGDAATILGRAALPFGLLAVGAALRWQYVAECRLAESVVCFVKLLALPALTAVLLGRLGVSGVALTIGVLFTALPTAPSAYLLARELGGDAEAMAALLSVQTVLALFTLPLVLSWVV